MLIWLKNQRKLRYRTFQLNGELPHRGDGVHDVESGLEGLRLDGAQRGHEADGARRDDHEGFREEEQSQSHGGERRQAVAGGVGLRKRMLKDVVGIQKSK